MAEEGYIGHRPDPVPSEHYSVAGVLAGKLPPRQPGERAGDGLRAARTVGAAATEQPAAPAAEPAEPEVQEEVDGPPPKAGKGSSTDAWANYAERHGVQVELDAGREDIIAACEQAGVPTE